MWKLKLLIAHILAKGRRLLVPADVINVAMTTTGM